MAEAEPDDPKTWSIDRVVYEFCENDNPPWTNPDAPHGATIVPDRHELESIFRKNHIDGDTLLTLTHKELRDDLAIPSYGQRLSMLKIIDFLVDRYYAEEKVRLYLEKGLPTPDITQSHPHIFQSPVYAQSASDIRPSIEQNNAFRMETAAPRDVALSMVNRLPGGPAIWSSSHQPFQSFPNQPTANLFGRAPSLPDLNTRISHTQPPVNSNHLAAAATKASRVPSEPQTTLATAQSEAKEDNVFDLLDAEIDRKLLRPTISPSKQLSASALQPAGKVVTPLSKPKKRLAPTFVRKLDIQDEHLGQALLTMDSTFFGDEVDSAKHFVMAKSDEPSGLRSIVNARLLNYYRRPPVHIKDSPLVVRKPYGHHKLANPSATQHVKVIGPGSASVVSKAEDWPVLKSPKLKHKIIRSTTIFKKATEAAAGIDEFDDGEAETNSTDEPLEYLDWIAQKYPTVPEDKLTGNDVYPGYGESGDEGEYDEDTWKEIEDEKEEDHQRSRVMTAEQVNQAIDEALVDIKKTWHEKSFPIVQAKGYKRWMEAAKARSRLPQLHDVEAEVEKSRESLAKFREGIFRDTWTKPADVKFQCQSLEEKAKTVFEFEYYVQVYHRDSAPEKPPKAAMRAKVPRKVQLHQDEESVGSDSEVNLDDFIVDDPLEPAIEAPFTEDDFNPMLPPPSPNSREQTGRPADKEIPGEVDREAIESPPANKAASEDIEMMSADDADVESDKSNDIVTPQSKVKRKLQKTLNSSKRRISKQVIQNANASDVSLSDSDLDAGPRLPKSRFRHKGQSKQDAIELISSEGPAPTSESHNTTEFEVQTPELNPDDSPVERTPARPTLKFKSSEPPPPHDGLPALSNVIGIKQLGWNVVEDSSDHLRALCKMIYSLEYDTAARLQKFIRSISPQGRTWLLQEGTMSLDSPDGQIPDVRNEDQGSAALLTCLFLSYLFNRDLVKRNVPSRADLDIAYEEAKKDQAKFFDQAKAALSVYLRYLADQLGDKLQSLTVSKPSVIKRKHPDPQISLSEQTPNTNNTDTADDYLIEEPQASKTSRKKRRKAVPQSQETTARQQTDQQRVKEEAMRQAQMEKRLALMKADKNAQYHINFEEPLVQLNPHIAQRVKPHQLDGIRFLWREIITDPKHQGCLLAHTMGLGKTMQVISLLVTISECIRSSDPELQQYIPDSLKPNRTLILCPPTLLENWYDELLMWIPKDALGTIRKILTSRQIPEIQAWASSSGVLLLSYDLFRTMINSRSKATDLYEKKDVEEWLLARPSIVVADEAHKLKNPKSKLTGVASRFTTKSRIALTGSPLNNHLEEYHTMIDWIAPGYLGTLQEFKSTYSEPITEGLYADSSAFERRFCLKKLHTLKRDIGPKIHRADISAVENDMPSKTEFFFTITLTEDQRKAYDVYIQRVLDTSDPESKATQAKLFAWVADLLLLCNHPACFVAVCDRRKEEARARYETDDENEVLDVEVEYADPLSPENESPFDTQTRRTKKDMTAMQEAAAVFNEAQMFETLEDASTSHRTLIIQQIVEKAAANGDKTLIFSHSIPSLDYLERMMRSLGHSFQRIDGKTSMNKRQQATKFFNTKDSEIKVFLISTRAGGLGLNLQGANRVILFDFNWNPMWEQQAVGRAYRLGQQKPVFVYRFRAGGTFEDVINNKAVFKNQLFQRVVDKKNPERYAKKSIAEFLAPPHDVPQQDYTNCLGKDDLVLDRIIGGLSEVVRNIELHETFEREDNEQLTAEELKAADEDAENEILRREDPKAWERKREALLAARAPPPSASYQQRMGFAVCGPSQSFSARTHSMAGHQIARPSGPVNTPKLTGSQKLPAMQNMLLNPNPLFQRFTDANAGSPSGETHNRLQKAPGNYFNVSNGNAPPLPRLLPQVDGPVIGTPRSNTSTTSSGDESKIDDAKDSPDCNLQ